jgi:hypothetical protein
MKHHRHLQRGAECDRPSPSTREAMNSDNGHAPNCVGDVTFSKFSNPTTAVLQASTRRAVDAETSGRIVVRHWDEIGEQGVFAAQTIIAGEIFGGLQGNIVRWKRLTRAERRQFIGIHVDGRASAWTSSEDGRKGSTMHHPLDVMRTGILRLGKLRRQRIFCQETNSCGIME